MKNRPLTTKVKKNLNDIHRQIGLILVAIVIFLSITGILLNHTTELELSKQHIKSETLLNWYGIKSPAIKSFKAGQYFISKINQQIYFDQNLLDFKVVSLNGAVFFYNLIVISIDDTLVLLTPKGDLVEQMDSTYGIPEMVTAIGLQHDQLVLRTQTGLFATDQDFLEWHKVSDHEIVWSQSQILDEALKDTITRSYVGNGLTAERIMLDIHSGRFFGQLGPLVMDLAALLFIFLALTGTWMHLKSSKLKIQYIRKNERMQLKKSGNYSIADLNPGDIGEILRIKGDVSLKQRLAEMGMVAGTKVAVSSTSLMGDPRCYTIRSYHITMRSDEAENILLKP